MISIRGGLLLSSRFSCCWSWQLVDASLLGTARLARDVAGSLMFELGLDAEFRLHNLFDPIRQKMNRGLCQRSGSEGGTRPKRDTRRNLLMPGLFRCPTVDSMMLADQKGASSRPPLQRAGSPVRAPQDCVRATASARPQPPANFSRGNSGLPNGVKPVAGRCGRTPDTSC